MNIICECPACDEEINLRGYKENETIVCAECETELEIVSLHPPVLEEPLDDEEEWDDDEEEWNGQDADEEDWNEQDDDQENWNEQDAGEEADKLWRKRSRLTWNDDDGDM